jgi:tetratricopeptide (TPR) repeat protein
MFTRTISFLPLVLACLFSAPNVSTAQIFPLSENTWTNPEFRARFLGTFGVNTRTEPEINRDEAQLFQELANIIGTDPNEAARRLRAALRPESSAALDFTLGSILFQTGDLNAAARHYRDAIRKFPNFLRAYRNLGLVLLQQNQFADAIPIIVKAIELGDNDAMLWGLLGFAYLNTERPQAAMDAYRIAHVLQPANRDWRVGKAQAATRIDRHPEAIALFGELLSDDPLQTNLWLARANSMIALGQEENAAHQLEIVRRMGRADASALRLLGDIYLNLQLPFLANVIYLEALNLEQSLPVSTALTVSRNLLMFGAFDEAEVFLEALERVHGPRLTDRQRLDTITFRAQIAIARGASDEAAALLEESLEIDPLNGRTLLLLGDHYGNIGDTAQAVFFYERAQTIDDVRYDALVQHGRLLVGLRDFGNAIPLLADALRMRPSPELERYLNAVRNAYEATR